MLHDWHLTQFRDAGPLTPSHKGAVCGNDDTPLDDDDRFYPLSSNASAPHELRGGGVWRRLHGAYDQSATATNTGIPPFAPRNPSRCCPLHEKAQGDAARREAQGDIPHPPRVRPFWRGPVTHLLLFAPLHRTLTVTCPAQIVLSEWLQATIWGFTLPLTVLIFQTEYNLGSTYLASISDEVPRQLHLCSQLILCFDQW